MSQFEWRLSSSIVVLYNFIMQGLIQRNTSIWFTPNLPNKQPLFSQRSIQSVESGQKNSQITPWKGEQFYSKIKKSIQKISRAKSATTKQAKYKSIQNRASNHFSKVKTMQLQLTPFPSQSRQKSLSIRPQTSQINRKQNVISFEKRQRNQKNYRFTTVSFVSPANVPQKGLSIRNTQQKIKVEHVNAQVGRRKVIQANPKFDEIDKRKSLLFFFQVRNHKIVNRQRMVMKIRNIEKGKANRAFNNIT